MEGRRSFQAGNGSCRIEIPSDPIHSVERLLLMVTVCAILFVAGIWLRNSPAGSAPPITATITVQAGDTLWGIAKEYGDPDRYILKRVNALARANNLERGRTLREGETLVIPVAGENARQYYGGGYASIQGAD